MSGLTRPLNVGFQVPGNKLMSYQEALRVAQDFSKEGARWPRGFGYLFDQLRRAMASVVLNQAEGNAKTSSADRRRFFRIARASTAEVAACVDLMLAFGLTSRACKINCVTA